MSDALSMTVIGFLLWIMALADGACAGFREAAGRSARIDKKAYYRQAVWHGLLWGQVAVGFATVLLIVFFLISTNKAELARGLIHAGNRMLAVYLPYAAVIALAFLARCVPSVDIRCITSVLFFGPLTFLRPYVAVAGMLWAIAAAHQLPVIILCVTVLVMMLSLEPLLARLRSG